jgi:hypothetical protein
MKHIKIMLSRTLDTYRAALSSMSTEDTNLEALYRARCVDPRRRQAIGARRQQWRERAKVPVANANGLR